jgi:ectoine hydroxylase-related dioxygenase (phytanoyl-CoA dioxygenase family)
LGSSALPDQRLFTKLSNTIHMLSKTQIQQYHADGYLLVKCFLSAPEAQKLRGIAIAYDAMRKHAFDLNDQPRKRTRLSLWYSPGNDACGLLTHSRRITKAVDQLLDGDGAVCHFHSKLMQKQLRVGGAWEWRQDYGYWYKNEFLFPGQMMSVMIAITDASKENGCLQVIGGSHKMGRVEHGFAGEQVGAAQRYVDLALQTLPHVYVELKAGDALFFHSNILHRSEANESDRPRWSLISCCNRSSNPPYHDPAGSSTVPISMVEDDALLLTNATGLGEGANFLEKRKRRGSEKVPLSVQWLSGQYQYL